MSVAPPFKSKDAYEEGVSVADSDELQLVKTLLSVGATLWWERKGIKTLSGAESHSLS